MLLAAGAWIGEPLDEFEGTPQAGDILSALGIMEEGQKAADFEVATSSPGKQLDDIRTQHSSSSEDQCDTIRAEYALHMSAHGASTAETGSQTVRPCGLTSSFTDGMLGRGAYLVPVPEPSDPVADPFTAGIDCNGAFAGVPFSWLMNESAFGYLTPDWLTHNVAWNDSSGQGASTCDQHSQYAEISLD